MIIAKPETRQQYVLTDGDPIPDGYIKMQSPMPGASHVATVSGVWELRYTKEQVDELRRRQYTLRTDPLMAEYLIKMAGGDGEGADALLAKAKAEREKIQVEYPYFAE